jgi:hypothetical protein
MNIFLIWLIAAFAAPATPAPAPAASAISDAEAAGIRWAEARGAMIYAYDQAAWHGTDDLAAKMPDYRDKVGGWIVDGPAESPELVFYDRDAAEPHALYIADFRNNALTSSRVLGPADDRSLSAARKAMIAARNAATAALEASDSRKCKPQPFNTVVLPPARPGEATLVYFLTPQTKNDAIPFGGHHLVEVSADGKAHPPRHFTNSCLELPLGKPKKGQPGMLFVTHLLDPVPTEIHVFSSLAAHVPVFVATVPNRHLWGVEGSHIVLVAPDMDKLAK